ncbi:MAG: hypothetical protein JWM91_1090 [Rhodospirillales bacterium]|nr:hypothetical protein [Rhodospirillales bacterium]
MKRWELGLAGGFADQGIVSFGNFALNVTLARALPAADYGAFSIALSFILFFNTLHQALITYPLSVRSAAANPLHHRHLLCVAAMLTPICALAFLPLLGAGMFSVAHFDLLPITFFALLSWQLQEIFRRGMLARARYPAAIALDLVRYFGTFVAALVLASRLTIGGVFLLIAATSLIAILPLALQIWQSVGSAGANLGMELARHWHMGAPVLGANLLAALSTQWFLWVLAWHQNPGGAAVLVALANVVAISSPVIVGIENILVPEVARTRDRLTFSDLLQLVGRRSFLCGTLIAPFFLLILAFPEEALRTFYGKATPYAVYPDALRILVAAYASYLGSYIFGAVLRGYRASRAVFKMQLYPAMFGLTLGSWLTWHYGVSGACVASLLAGLLRASVGFHFVLRLRASTMTTASAVAAS